MATQSVQPPMVKKVVNGKWVMVPANEAAPEPKPAPVTLAAEKPRPPEPEEPEWSQEELDFELFKDPKGVERVQATQMDGDGKYVHYRPTFRATVPGAGQRWLCRINPGPPLFEDKFRRIVAVEPIHMTRGVLDDFRERAEQVMAEKPPRSKIMLNGEPIDYDKLAGSELDELESAPASEPRVYYEPPPALLSPLGECMEGRFKSRRDKKGVSRMQFVARDNQWGLIIRQVHENNPVQPKEGESWEFRLEGLAYYRPERKVEGRVRIGMVVYTVSPQAIIPSAPRGTKTLKLEKAEESRGRMQFGTPGGRQLPKGVDVARAQPERVAVEASKSEPIKLRSLEDPDFVPEGTSSARLSTEVARMMRERLPERGKAVRQEKKNCKGRKKGSK